MNDVRNEVSRYCKATAKCACHGEELWKVQALGVSPTTCEAQISAAEGQARVDIRLTHGHLKNVITPMQVSFTPCWCWGTDWQKRWASRRPHIKRWDMPASHYRVFSQSVSGQGVPLLEPAVAPSRLFRRYLLIPPWGTEYLLLFPQQSTAAPLGRAWERVHSMYDKQIGEGHGGKVMGALRCGSERSHRMNGWTFVSRGDLNIQTQRTSAPTWSFGPVTFWHLRPGSVTLADYCRDRPIRGCSGAVSQG